MPHTNYSAHVPLKTEEQIAWAMALHGTMIGLEVMDAEHPDWQPVPEGIVVNPSQEHLHAARHIRSLTLAGNGEGTARSFMLQKSDLGGINVLPHVYGAALTHIAVVFIQVVLKKFDLNDAVAFQRPTGCGGVAYFITKDQVKECDTGDWLAEQEKEHQHQILFRRLHPYIFNTEAQVLPYKCECGSTEFQFDVEDRDTTVGYGTINVRGSIQIDDWGKNYVGDSKYDTTFQCQQCDAMHTTYPYTMMIK